MIDFRSLSLPANVSLFFVAAAVVWWAGTRLTGYADAISERLGRKPALVGLVMLGSVASLPEMATSVSASLLGQPDLAINTLLGGISVTLVILAIVDAARGREPLSISVSHPVLLLQAALAIMLLTVAAAGMVAGDVEMLGAGFGVWSFLLLVLYVGSVLLVRRYEGSDAWIPKQKQDTSMASPRGSHAHRDASWRTLATSCSAVAAVVIVAGYILASTGDAIAEKTGISQGVVGIVLGGIATSLPELSTTFTAVRLREYELAFGDAFGTNLFSTMLLFFADLAAPGEPLLNTGGRFSLFAVLLGIALTTVYLMGLIERRKFVVWKMGFDSFVVLILYALGLVVLSQLQG